MRPSGPGGSEAGKGRSFQKITDVVFPSGVSNEVRGATHTTRLDEAGNIPLRGATDVRLCQAFNKPIVSECTLQTTCGFFLATTSTDPRQKPKTSLSQRPKASAEDGMRRLQARPKLGTADVCPRHHLQRPLPLVGFPRCSQVATGRHTPVSRFQELGGELLAGCRPVAATVGVRESAQWWRDIVSGSSHSALVPPTLSPWLPSAQRVARLEVWVGRMDGWMDGRKGSWVD